jgi:hypothetical protein
MATPLRAHAGGDQTGQARSVTTDFPRSENNAAPRGLSLVGAPVQAPARRTPDLARIIHRMADQGIPLRAICRSIGWTLEDVEQVIDDALASGMLIKRPDYDWPKRSHHAANRARISNTRALLDLHLTFGLAPQEARLVWQVYRAASVSKEVVHNAISGETAPRIVAVVLSRARRKLSADGITIETIWGLGYRMDVLSKERLCARCGWEAQD